MAKDGKKKITHAQRTGRRGEHLVADLVLDMGFIWHGSDPLESGLDGFIELADVDGTLVSQYIACQSKAVTDGFENDDGETFTFTAEAADLDYWLAMSDAVILVLSNPVTREAYYVSVKDYFADVQRRIKRKVVFNKKTDGLAGQGPRTARSRSPRGRKRTAAGERAPSRPSRCAGTDRRARQGTACDRARPQQSDQDAVAQGGRALGRACSSDDREVWRAAIRLAGTRRARRCPSGSR